MLLNVAMRTDCAALENAFAYLVKIFSRCFHDEMPPLLKCRLSIEAGIYVATTKSEKKDQNT